MRTSARHPPGSIALDDVICLDDIRDYPLVLRIVRKEVRNRPLVPAICAVRSTDEIVVDYITAANLAL